MKKMFLAAAMALALSSYSYAYDDDEYEEEEAPARVVKQAPAIDDEEEEEDAAPVASAKKSKKSSDGKDFIGIGMGLTTNFQDKGLKEIDVKVKLNESMMVTGIIGLYHHGETSVETKIAGQGTTNDGGDNYTAIAIGAGFDYFLPTPLLPTSAGIDLIYVSNGETETVDEASNTTTTVSSGNFMIDLVFGIHAELMPHLILSGKAGLGFDYNFASNEVSNAIGSVETTQSRLDFGLKAGVYVTWFFL